MRSIHSCKCSETYSLSKDCRFVSINFLAEPAKTRLISAWCRIERSIAKDLRLLHSQECFLGNYFHYNSIHVVSQVTILKKKSNLIFVQMDIGGHEQLKKKSVATKQWVTFKSVRVSATLMMRVQEDGECYDKIWYRATNLEPRVEVRRDQFWLRHLEPQNQVFYCSSESLRPHRKTQESTESKYKVITNPRQLSYALHGMIDSCQGDQKTLINSKYLDSLHKKPW